MKHLRALNRYFYKYRWRLFLGTLFVVAANFFRVLQPRIIRHAFDLITEELRNFRSLAGSPLQDDLYASIGQSLLIFGGLVLLLALVMGVFMFFMRQTIIVMSRLIEYDLRKDLYDHYQRLDLGFFRRNNTGDLMSRITEDVSNVRMYVGPAVMYGINLTTLVILALYSMFSVNWKLSLYTLIPLPFLSLTIYIVSSIIMKKSIKIQGQISFLNSIAQEVYSGIRVVKSYVQEKPMQQFFAKESEQYKEDTMDLARTEALFRPLMVVMIGASTILTIYMGGVLYARGEISAGNIAEFIIYVNMLTWPVTAIGWVASIIQRAAASQKRINEFLDTESQIQDPGGADKVLTGQVEFDDVSFIYPDSGIRAVHNLNFSLKQGDRLAIVGKTGSGKTTVADLLVRMYDASKGTIRLDGHDIKSIPLKNLREQIGYVPQDVFLFSDTVENNIAFGSDETDKERVREYAKYAAVHDDIEGLSEGYQTMVGERGVTLSGGQKQRVSIARALIQEPKILILDDCLSAVDMNTEKAIVDFFEEKLKNQTVIIVTHRIYPAIQFDKIICLEDGEIAEIGKHQDLISSGGFYAQMFERQQIDERRKGVV